MPPRTMGLRLAAAALIPLAVGGCERPEALGGKGKTAAAPVPAVADSWILVEKGERKTEDGLPEGKAAPVEPHALQVPHLPEPVHLEPPDPRCVGAFTPGKIAPLDVEAGATTATVSWYHPGDPSVQIYRITSISQRLVVGTQKPLTWQETEPGPSCATLTTTVRGLQPGTPYVFSVDVVRQATWQNNTRAATIARSGPVFTD